MFGIKIISEERYRSEQESAQNLIGINENLVKRNAQLELDIKSLREQNSKLRSINGKRKNELDDLIEKNRKLREQVKVLNDADIDVKVFEEPANCAACKHETWRCKKITIGDKDICIIAKPSFRTNK